MSKEHAMATRDRLDGIEPSSNAGGRPQALKPEHIAVLHDIVAERA
jgi:putative transposase